MRVLVTGSSGLVGAAIVKHLANAGHDVVGLSRGHGHALPASIRQISVDLETADAFGAICRDVERCDAIVHSAANLDMRLHAPEVSQVNCAGTQQVLHVAERWNVDSFVFISSVGVIGLPVHTPITEEHPCAPRTAYHATKLCGEHFVRIAAGGGMSAISLRLTAPVGPGTPPGRLMRVLVERALANKSIILNGRGTRRQNYVDVRDVAGAVALGLESKASGVFNIGGAGTISNLELAKHCISILDGTSSITFSEMADSDDLVDWTISLERAKSILGYSPQFNLHASIRAIAAECRT